MDELPCDTTLGVQEVLLALSLPKVLSHEVLWSLKHGLLVPQKPYGSKAMLVG